MGDYARAFFMEKFCTGVNLFKGVTFPQVDEYDKVIVEQKGRRLLEDVMSPVNVQTFVAKSTTATIYYPQIYLPEHLPTAQSINHLICDIVNGLIEKQYKEQDTDEFGEMIGTFEVKANERNILSITFMNYAIIPFAAHGLTFMESLNVNVKSGKVYELSDLFKSGSNYQRRLTNIINKQIKERQLDVFSPDGIDTIPSDQRFYLTDQTLVIYFQQYDIAPYYVGLPLFPIPIYELEDIVSDHGPLDILSGN